MKPDEREAVLIYGPFQPPDQPCGVSAALRSFVASPIREQFDLEVVSTYRGQDEERGLAARLAYGLWLFVASWLRIARSRARLVDIHAVSDRDFLKHGAVLLAAGVAGRPTLLRIHGGDFDRVYARSSETLRALTRWLLRRADRVVLLSPGWEHIVNEIEPRAATAVLSNSVPCDELERLGEQREKDSHRVLMLGNLCERKGHFDALEAAAILAGRLPDCVMEFGGVERDAGARAQLDARAEALGLGGAVRFLGSVSGDAKDRAFTEAALYMLPSHTENMPVSIMEAMATGLPVVATPVGAIPEMVRDGETGVLVPARDPAALADAIEGLFRDPERRTKMSARARAFAREHWDRASIARRTAALYRELLAAQLVQTERPR